AVANLHHPTLVLLCRRLPRPEPAGTVRADAYTARVTRIGKLRGLQRVHAGPLATRRLETMRVGRNSSVRNGSCIGVGTTAAAAFLLALGAAGTASAQLPCRLPRSSTSRGTSRRLRSTAPAAPTRTAAAC